MDFHCESLHTCLYVTAQSGAHHMLESLQSLVGWKHSSASEETLSHFTSIYSTNKRLFGSAERGSITPKELSLFSGRPGAAVAMCCLLHGQHFRVTQEHIRLHVVLFPQHLLSFHPPAAPGSPSQRSCVCVQQSLQASSLINCFLNQ